jgi:hypothetical protein
VLSPEIGTIDTMGNFQGKTMGETKVVAQFGEYSDTANVTVAICEGVVQVDIMDNISGWSINGEVLNLENSYLSLCINRKTVGNSSFKVDYEFTRSATSRSWLYLNTDLFINGVPESIDFDFLSDGYKHKAYVYAEDVDGQQFKSVISGYAQDTTSFDTLRGLSSKFTPVILGTELNYPIRIKSLRIKLGNSAEINEINRGTLYFDNLRVVYPATSINNSRQKTNGLKNFHLYENYPNPFNPKTSIPLILDKKDEIHLIVYDLLGNKIKTLANGIFQPGSYQFSWDSCNEYSEKVSSGIYLYTLRTGNSAETKKMILLR